MESKQSILDPKQGRLLPFLFDLFGLRAAPCQGYESCAPCACLSTVSLSLSVVFLVNGVFNPKQSFGKSHRYFPTCFVHITLKRAYFTLHPKKVAD